MENNIEMPDPEDFDHVDDWLDDEDLEDDDEDEDSCEERGGCVPDPEDFDA